MRRLLFLVSCGFLAWAVWSPVRSAPEPPADASFEERVFAMAEARNVVNRELRDRADAIRDRVVAIADRVPRP